MGKPFSYGIDETISMFDTLAGAGRAIVSAALYSGAVVMADAVAQAISALQVDDDPSHPFSSPVNVITSSDKADMLAAVGIAHFDDTADGRSTSISIDGYASRTEKRYPSGVPLVMIARSIESGSSVRPKRAFIRSATNAAKGACEQAMVEAGEKKVQEIVGEVG